MAVLTFTIHLTLNWGERAVFMSTWNFSFIFPHVAEGLLQDRTVNLQLRINPESGRVSISVETPDMEEP